MSKFALLIKNGSFNNLNTAALIASGCIANDHEILMFFMHDAVWSLKRDNFKNNLQINSIYPEVSAIIIQEIKKGTIQVWYDLIPELKEIGIVKIVACSQMMDIFKLTKEDLVDFVDEVAGVAYFVSEAENSSNIITL